MSGSAHRAPRILLAVMVLVGVGAGVLLPSCMQRATSPPPPTGWTDTDLSAGAVPGSSASDDHALTMRGTMDAWGTADGGRFHWCAIAGDATLTACVTRIENPGAMIHAKASLCMRESLAPGARAVTWCVTAGDGTQLIARAQPDATASLAVAMSAAARVPKAHVPCWLRLVRHGHDFTAYESLDGTTWILSGQVSVEMGPAMMVGVSVTSHKADVLTTAVFTDITVQDR